MNSFKHYVPVLRWKQAEWLALRELSDKHRNLITPLIEPTPQHFRKEKVAELDKEINRTVDNIQKSWGLNSFFFDSHLTSHVTDEKYLLEEIFKKANEKNLAMIPVTSFSRSVDYNLILRKILKKNNCGLCLRIDATNYKLENMKDHIDKLCEFFNLSPEQMDLIIDYKLITHKNEVPKLVLLCQSIPYLHMWRSFTTLSGVFPKYLSEFSVDIHYIKREDWLMWVGQLDVSLKRIPSFGDYTIQHPLFSEPPPGASPSASIRYTIENDWLLFRGEGLNKKNSAGHAQYPAHAQLLAERNEFSGPDFSMGDLYVYDMAQRAAREEKVQNPGNPGSWIKAGINHHLTFVATQISTLDVI